jgi:hypothetical protein
MQNYVQSLEDLDQVMVEEGKAPVIPEIKPKEPEEGGNRSGRDHLKDG